MSLAWLFLACQPSAPVSLNEEVVVAEHQSISSTQESTDRPPSSLPPPARDHHRAQGERVRFNQVVGYLARRSDHLRSIGILLTGDSLSAQDQHLARQLADSPAVVLLISPDVDPAQGEAYLLGMEGITGVERQSTTEGAP